MTTDVVLSNGRIVDVLRGGATTGPALVMHHGTPLDATIWDDWDDVARDAGLQRLRSAVRAMRVRRAERDA